MPLISKQSASPKPARNGPAKSSGGSVLDRIVSVGENDSGGLHVSLYGRSKTGKTRLLSSFPKPVLIIGAEDGTKSVSTVKGVDFVRLGNSDEINQIADGLRGRSLISRSMPGELYKSVGVDTASALQDLILADILGLDQLPTQKHWGMASREQYGDCALRTKTLLKRVLELPLHVVITAHERNFNEEATSDMLLPSIGSALSPSVAAWLNGAVDYICQTFIRAETKSIKVEIGEGKDKVVEETFEKTGKAEYCLRVGPDPIYMTGFRMPPGQELPDHIVNPTFDKINTLVKGGKLK